MCTYSKICMSLFVDILCDLFAKFNTDKPSANPDSKKSKIDHSDDVL